MGRGSVGEEGDEGLYKKRLMLRSSSSGSRLETETRLYFCLKNRKPACNASQGLFVRYRGLHHRRNCYRHLQCSCSSDPAQSGSIPGQSAESRLKSLRRMHQHVGRFSSYSLPLFPDDGARSICMSSCIFLAPISVSPVSVVQSCRWSWLGTRLHVAWRRRQLHRSLRLMLSVASHERRPTKG
jgi:hypothetical protein